MLIKKGFAIAVALVTATLSMRAAAQYGAWQPLGTGLCSWVDACANFDNQLIAAGWFNMGNDNCASPMNYVARWDGSSWQPLGSGTNGRVQALTVWNAQLIAGGDFSVAGGQSANSVASWDGVSWRAMVGGSGGPGRVFALTTHSQELIAGTEPGFCVARWNGTDWQPLGNPQLAGFVFSLAHYNGELIAGGQFAGGFNNIAKWNGSSWVSLGSGVNGGVLALAEYGGDLYAGGTFTMAGSASASRIARWDGSAWHALGGASAGPNDTVLALKPYRGDLIVGGFFTSMGRNISNRIARWNGPSATWLPMGSGMDQPVRCLAEYNDRVVVGGQFSVAGGQAANRIALSACIIASSAPQSNELAPFAFNIIPTWTATGIAPTSTGATLTVTARGNLGSTTKFLTIKIDGTVLATNVFGAGSGAGNCTAAASTVVLPISPALFSSLTADGQLLVRIEPSLNATSVGCANATLTVRLDYTRNIIDCDGDGLDDACNIAASPQRDCNHDGILDNCQQGSAVEDCNMNGIVDACEITDGAEDKNNNGRLDSCELLYGDLNLDGQVNGADLGGLLTVWGLPNPPYGDLNGDGVVNGADLGTLLVHWGPVP